jgi:hypothetical protein
MKPPPAVERVPDDLVRDARSQVAAYVSRAARSRG